jgi:Type VI secretion system VasI, EvfG, VC_A0118
MTDKDEMSCRGKQPQIFCAIGALFVISGSSASNALPPQAITEEAKWCKAISNDQQRLKCFDSLFADKPNQTKPLEKSANEDNWSIEESKSSMDGSQQIVAANLVGDTVLILRCKDQTTEAAFSTRYNYLGSRSVDVTLRINDDKPFKQVWKASIDGRAAFASDAVEFIRMLPDNAKLFIGTSRADGKTKEANFNLGNVSDIKNKIAHACSWDHTLNEPVGSVDRSGHR